MSDKVKAPVVVVFNGRRYVLTANGVTRVARISDENQRKRPR